MKKFFIFIMALMTMSSAIHAQKYGEEGPTLTPNKLGLVYENAIEENKRGEVNIH